MKKIWVSSAGTGNAFATVKAIKKYFPEFFVLTTDTNPSHLTTASLLADVHEISSSITNAHFENFVINTIEKYSIDTYIPFIDTEITLAAKMYEENKIRQDIILQVKNHETGKICENKLSSFYFLQSIGVDTPLTALAEHPFPANEYILKPLYGFGSQIKKITPSELDQIPKKEEYIVQEICENPEITIDVARSKNHDRFHYICRERLQTKSGVCTKARLFTDEKLGEIAYVLAEKLELSAFCFQVMRLKEKWVVTDINPRLGAGTALCNPTGTDFFGAMLAILWGSDPAPYFKSLDKEYYVTRQYEEYLMPF